MEALREDVLNLLKTPAYAPKADFVVRMERFKGRERG